MFSLSRSSTIRSARHFSSSSRAQFDVAKLTLVGRLARDPETRNTKNEKEYVAYTVATQVYPPPRNSDGTFPEKPLVNFHRVLSFNSTTNQYIKELKKGTQVWVEANFEVKEPEADAEPGTARALRHIFLRHENIRILGGSRPKDDTRGSNEGHHGNH
ncbi:hypothetical protein FRC03_011767 [Tulasnella sp. 419]|nr:hypothetical protein FRC02_009647 [Tulasnella sp. 418]KAG8966537.1 hypothetical protein FRC03_011767 [Tulasnella sp. 419]